MRTLPVLSASLSSSFFGFSHQGSPQRIFHFQLFLSSVSSSVTSTSAMSSFATSINLLFGLPRFPFPGNSILSTLLPIYPSSFLSTCSYHLSLASRVFSPNRPTCAVPLMSSFLILSILVTPNENRSIFNSATSISASCLFVSATVSNPYNIAGLTATLYTFPFTLAGTRLSQITPDILLQPFHPACTLFFTSLPHSPLLCTVEPRYLKSSTGFEINTRPLARGDWKSRGMSRIFAQVVRLASGYFNLFCQLPGMCDYEWNKLLKFN